MRIVSLVLILVQVSCASYSELPGEYTNARKGYNFSLVMNRDNTFALDIRTVYGYSGCKGIWRLRGDTLLLRCNEEHFPAQIVSGYMVEREQIAIVKNKKIKLGAIVLKRD